MASLSPILQQGLEQYRIGPRLRSLRLRKKIGLVELGTHTGLSAALLSKIERGRLFPTLPTLLRIALVFGVGLDYFFHPDQREEDLAIVRKKDRQRFPDRPDSDNVAFHFESLDFTAQNRKLSGYLAEFEPLPPENAEPHEHDGVEFLYVIRGKLALRVGEREETLETGDSCYFDSSISHSYRRIGKRPCTAVVVTVP